MKKLSLAELNRASVEEFQQVEKWPFVFVLDNIRSGVNVGSIFRTADAFRLEKLLLCGITAQPPHREILKTALGSTESVAWSYEAETLRAVEALRAEGFRVWAVEQTTNSLFLQQFQAGAGEKQASRCCRCATAPWRSRSSARNIRSTSPWRRASWPGNWCEAKRAKLSNPIIRPRTLPLPAGTNILCHSRKKQPHPA